MISGLSIIIPFFNGHGTLFRLIDSLPSYVPIIIVDDCSDQPLERQIWMQDNVTIVRMPRKGYFAGAVNVGIQACKTDVLVLNQDVWFGGDEVRWEWMRVLAQHRDQYAMIGERIRGEHPAFPKGYIHGTFMFLRRDAIQKVGLLNAQQYPLWGNTAEWQWRAARAGFAILPLGHIPGMHHARQHGQRYGSSIRQLLEREPQHEHWFIQTPPLVSVIVPCFNYGRYLRDCIHSLIGGPTSLGDHPGQTIKSLEIIIVDDCSTDDSAEIARRFADDWKGIRFYQMPANGGTALALNYGIERAVGKYITFLSADDMREPDSLEKLIQACEANPHHFAYDDIQMFGHGEHLRTWRMEEYDFQRLLYKNHVHAGILYPRQAWVDAGGYPPQMEDGREDWAFNVALGQVGWCGVHVRNYGYLYRREGQNRSLTNSDDAWRMRFLAKLQAIFPHLYEGDFPMGCCGGKRTTYQRRVTSMATTQNVASSAPAEGMVRIEYTGNQQDAVWRGSTTRTPYRFGAGRRVGYVYQSDLGELGGGGFLGLRKNGVNVFRLYDGSQLQSPQQQTRVVNENVGAGQMRATLTPAGQEASSGEEQDGAPDDGLTFPHPSTLTVEQVQELDLTPEQWQTLLDLEQAEGGKQRKGVIEHASSQINAATENA